MRLITWNCCMGFRKKINPIMEYKPDILIIQECEKIIDYNLFPVKPTSYLWVGNNLNKGLGVFSFNNHTMKISNDYDPAIEYSIPINISNKLNLISLWAMNSKYNPKERYIARVYSALKKYDQLFKNNTIVAGDFNWNKNFAVSSPINSSFDDVINSLDDYSLKSSYHLFYNENYGIETNPTFYLHKNKQKGYHIDYIFLKEKIFRNLILGDFEYWKKFSDHVPLIVEFDI